MSKLSVEKTKAIYEQVAANGHNIYGVFLCGEHVYGIAKEDNKMTFCVIINNGAVEALYHPTNIKTTIEGCEVYIKDLYTWSKELENGCQFAMEVLYSTDYTLYEKDNDYLKYREILRKFNIEGACLNRISLSEKILKKECLSSKDVSRLIYYYYFVQTLLKTQDYQKALTIPEDVLKREKEKCLSMTGKAIEEAYSLKIVKQGILQEKKNFSSDKNKSGEKNVLFKEIQDSVAKALAEKTF